MSVDDIYRELVDILYFLGDIYFSGEPSPGFDVRFTDELLADLHEMKSIRKKFSKLRDDPLHLNEYKEKWRKQATKIITTIFT